jgi:hypothetical protein
MTYAEIAERNKKIKEDYLNNNSMRSLECVYGLSHQSISLILRKMGVEIRSKSQKRNAESIMNATHTVKRKKGESTVQVIRQKRSEQAIIETPPNWIKGTARGISKPAFIRPTDRIIPSIHSQYFNHQI